MGKRWTHQRAARNRVVGRIEVEDRGRSEHMLPQPLAPVPAQRLAIAAAIECAQHAGEQQHRFAQLAVGARGRIGAGLGIHQHRRHRGREVAPRAIAEHHAVGGEAPAGEGRGHALHIGRARVAAHQVLDQLLADEGRGVGVLHQAVEHQLQRGRPSGVGRHGDAREQAARRGVAIARHGHHVTAVVLAVGAGRVAAPRSGAAGRVGPAREREGVGAHGVVAVGRGARAALERAVGVELTGADGEKLQQLARIVLVGGVPCHC